MTVIPHSMKSPAQGGCGASDIVERLNQYAEDWRDRASTADIVREAASEITRLRDALENPRKYRHRYWGAGEPDCPADLKAGNGELHTLRCKLCGSENGKTEVCLEAIGAVAS